MRRLTSAPRENWAALIESQGLAFHRSAHPEGLTRPYWDESVHYVFTMDEVLALEEQVEELHRMCLAAADHIVASGRFADLGIPPHCRAAVAESWRRRDPHVFGRFDLRYDGTGPAKLLEYNADTPTSLVESSVVQWFWLKDVYPEDDQWNSIHERLVDRWKSLTLQTGPAHFAWTSADETGEEAMTIGYLQETRSRPGWSRRRSPWRTSAGTRSTTGSSTWSTGSSARCASCIPGSGSSRSRSRRTRSRSRSR